VPTAIKSRDEKYNEKYNEMSREGVGDGMGRVVSSDRPAGPHGMLGVSTAR
jgi:hypothetical protein